MSKKSLYDDKMSNVLPEAKSIPMSEIYSDDNFNCRRGRIDPKTVVDLANNIEANGLLQPITIQPYVLHPPHKYRIVIGHRRYAAFKQLGWPTIPAVIKEGLSDIDAMSLNLVENINRKDLNLMEEAIALKKFKDAGVTLKDMSKKINKSPGWVQIRFAALTLPEEIQQAIAGGVIVQEQVKDIASLGSKELQFEAVRRIKESKERGERKAIKLKKPKKNLLKRKERNKAERGEMLGHVLDTLGPCIVTRVLAWSNGDISELDLHRDLQEFAESQGKRYAIPKDLYEAAAPAAILTEAS